MALDESMFFRAFRAAGWVMDASATVSGQLVRFGVTHAEPTAEVIEGVAQDVDGQIEYETAAVELHVGDVVQIDGKGSWRLVGEPRASRTGYHSVAPVARV